MKRIILLFLMAVLLYGNASAIKDSDGNESTQYILDYKTGEKKYFDCETVEEFAKIVEKELRMNKTITVDETGTTLEYTIDNALFFNFDRIAFDCEDGDYYVVHIFDQYIWASKESYWPSNPNNKNYTESTILPGMSAEFKTMDHASSEDVKISLLSVETTDIGTCSLLNDWYYDKSMWDDLFNKKAREVSSESDFLPETYFAITTDDSDKESLKIYCYFGKYNPETWDLKAVTHIKFHISNAVPKYHSKVAYPGLFHEDREWTYVAEENGENPKIIKMRFDGTTNYEGSSYHNFRNTYTGYCVPGDNNEWTIEETSSLPTILVREKEGEVYGRIPESYLIGGDGISFDSETGLSEEVQLYDFGYPVGGIFNGMFCTGNKMKFEVIDESRIHIENSDLRRIKVRSREKEYAGQEWDVIENIGVVSGNGFFAFFNSPIIKGDSFKTAAGAGYEVNLWKVTDTDGNILYKARDYDFPDPGFGVIEGTPYEERCGDGIRYDLFGQRISEPARGQVYILNGRKYVKK